MMSLITGTPGSGKTLYAVSRIIEEAAKGRLIFSNIDGLAVPGVHPMPDDLDWRNTPDGSLIVYDEAQQHEMFKNLGKGNSKEPIVSDMEIHRHTGHDLIFITQHPRLISSHIRSLIGEHINVHRPYGAPIASAYRWGVCEDNPNTKTAQNRAEANFKVPFKKEWFRFYKSATMHTHRFRIPENLRNMFIFLLLIIAGVWFMFGKSTLFQKTQAGLESGGKIGAPSQQSGLSVTPAGPAAAVSADPRAESAEVLRALEVNRPALIVSDSSGLCIAKNRYGMPLATVTADQCARLAASPGRLMYGTLSDAPASAPAAAPAALPASAATPAPAAAPAGASAGGRALPFLDN